MNFVGDRRYKTINVCDRNKRWLSCCDRGEHSINGERTASTDQAQCADFTHYLLLHGSDFTVVKFWQFSNQLQEPNYAYRWPEQEEGLFGNHYCKWVQQQVHSLHSTCVLRPAGWPGRLLLQC